MLNEHARSRMIEALPPPGKPVTNLPELITTMGHVAAIAPEVGLGHLRYGLHAYQRVTAAVSSEVDKENFDDPQKMARTMPLFAKRIFDPIEHHIHERYDQVGAWSHMFYSPEAKRALPSTAMVDFLGFHVLYDLPFTLKDSNTEDRHKKDYSQKINLILARVGRELLPEYIDLHAPLKKLRAGDIGLGMVMAHLIFSRRHAWQSFKRLEAAEQLIHSTPDSPLGQHAATPSPLQIVDQELGELATRRMLSTKKAAHFILQRAGRVPTNYWENPLATEDEYPADK